MFAYIRGILAEVAKESIVIEANGIGYHIFFPINAISALPVAGDTYKAYIHYVSREDGVTLFGFPGKAERELFELLLLVSGIGPKGAMAIVGSARIEHLYACIAAAETSGLIAIPGIGKKTAERIVLELKEKIRKIGITGSENLSGDIVAGGFSEAYNALLALGFSANRARQALTALSPDDVSLPVEDVIRKALAALDEQRR